MSAKCGQGAVAEGTANPWLILAVTATGLLMVVVDITILNVALPPLTADLGATLADAQWTIIAYTVVLTGLVPLFGHVSDVIGRKRLFIAGKLLFATASLLAGLSPSIPWLIAARVVQAVGGALISANVLAIVADTFPAGRRGLAMAVQTIIVSAGAAAGPVLGGVLVSQFGWQAVFFVNVPIGILAAGAAAVLLPPFKSHRTLEAIDWLGAALLFAAICPLLLGLTKGPEWGWSSPLIGALLGGGLVFLVAFIARERLTAAPLVDLTLFRIPPFAAGQIAGMLATISMASLIFLFPYYWQSLRGLSAQFTGLLLLPVPLMIMAASPLAGRVADRMGTRAIGSLGLATMALGLTLLGRITMTSAYWDVIWRMALFGWGLGMFLAPNNMAVMSCVPAHKRGIAAGLLSMARFMGQTLGVAFAGAIFAIFARTSGAVDQVLAPQNFAQFAAGAGVGAGVGAAFMRGLAAVNFSGVPFAAFAGLVVWRWGWDKGEETARRSRKP